MSNITGLLTKEEMRTIIEKGLADLPKLYSTDSKPKEKILKLFNPFALVLGI